MGRTLDDVRALVLTHAHSDHVGFAERIRRERGVPIRVHADDAAARPRRGEAGARRDRAPGYRGWSIARASRASPLTGCAHGLTTGRPDRRGRHRSPTGRPSTCRARRASSTCPGHTPGSVALHVPARDAVFVGDAFVTRNVVTGRRGPHFATQFNADNRQAVASLARLDGLAARHVLPGHGDPWSGGLDEAVRLVRASVPAELANGAAPQS